MYELVRGFRRRDDALVSLPFFRLWVDLLTAFAWLFSSIKSCSQETNCRNFFSVKHTDRNAQPIVLVGIATKYSDILICVKDFLMTIWDRGIQWGAGCMNDINIYM